MVARFFLYQTKQQFPAQLFSWLDFSQCSKRSARQSVVSFLWSLTRTDERLCTRYFSSSYHTTTIISYHQYQVSYITLNLFSPAAPIILLLKEDQPFTHATPTQKIYHFTCQNIHAIRLQKQTLPIERLKSKIIGERTDCFKLEKTTPICYSVNSLKIQKNNCFIPRFSILSTFILVILSSC